MLPRFNIIVAIDEMRGIAKDGKLPWPKNKEDMKHFRTKTAGNIVIMGRTTFESIGKPLDGRENIIIANKEYKTPDGTYHVHSPLGALTKAQEIIEEYKDDATPEVYVIGGEKVYNSFMKQFLYLVSKFYITKIPGDYECDKFFIMPPEGKKLTCFVKSDTCSFIEYTGTHVHPETKYLQILQNILDKGVSKDDRTGVGTLSLHGQVMEFDILNSVPFITTKKLFHKTVLKELLWFLDGSTNSKLLEDEGVNIWKGNSSKEFIESRGLKYEEGDIGPGYGFQWRHWGAEYKGCHVDYTGQGIDQIENLVQGLINDPNSRRHILSAWNISDLDKMVLPPCHYSAQFLVDGKYLDCLLNQRSGDMFLGVPFNIASYTFLTYMIAEKTNLIPRKLIHIIGDAHIYKNHIDQVKEQLTRTPLPWCTIDMDENEIPVVMDYISWPAIKAPMAV